MWYNLTMQIRGKVDELGKVFLGARLSRSPMSHARWPTWDGTNVSVRSQTSDESGALSPLSASMGNIRDELEKSSPKGKSEGQSYSKLALIILTT